MEIKTISINSAAQRILLIVIGLIFLMLIFFATKWFLGNSISSQAIQYEVADFAISLAPNDPRTHFTKGYLLERSLQPDDLPKSLAEYEQAVALSPNDYLLWLAYGKAKERNGDAEGAEKVLKKALELAPDYSEVQWTYGNILLRQNKTKEAFAMIRRAVDGNSKFAGPAATTAWNIFDGDIDEVKRTVGDSNPVKSALATFLAGQKRFSKSLEIWNNLPEGARKTTFRKDSENILRQLIKEKKYRSALPVKALLTDDKEKNIAIEKVTDSGFENITVAADQETFEWQIAKGNKPVIGSSVDQKNSGEKSLALVFKSPRGKDFRKVSQAIAVNGDETYEFKVFYKSNLETSATLKWEIADAQSGIILASTDATEAKSDWSSLSVDFTTPEDSEGIIIRLAREKCVSADCSISGTIWFDDVSLN